MNRAHGLEKKIQFKGEKWRINIRIEVHHSAAYDKAQDTGKSQKEADFFVPQYFNDLSHMFL
jgi:hypothetical protein